MSAQRSPAKIRSIAAWNSSGAAGGAEKEKEKERRSIPSAAILAEIAPQCVILTLANRCSALICISSFSIFALRIDSRTLVGRAHGIQSPTIACERPSRHRQQAARRKKRQRTAAVQGAALRFMTGFPAHFRWRC